MNDLQKKLVDERFDKLFLDMPLYSFCNFRKIKNLVHSEIERAEKEGYKAGLVLDECLMKKFMKDERIESIKSILIKIPFMPKEVENRINEIIAEMEKELK